MKKSNYITPEMEVTLLSQASTLCASGASGGASVEGPGMPGGSNDDPFAGMFPVSFRRKPISIRH